MERDFWRREISIWRRMVEARARSNRFNQERKMRKAPFPRGDLRWRGDGRKILGLDLGFWRGRRRGLWVLEGGRRKWSGSAHERVFNLKERNSWDVGRKLQVCHWVDPRGSTHGSQNLEKIDEQFSKNLKL